MGGAGDLLLLALNVPPWEDLHELSRPELRLTNLLTTDAVTDVLPSHDSAPMPMAEAKPSKPTQDRFVSQQRGRRAGAEPAGEVATKTAEAVVPDGGNAVPAPVQSSEITPISGKSFGAMRASNPESRCSPMRTAHPRSDPADHPGMTTANSRRSRLPGLRLDLADRVDHGIESQQLLSRCVARPVVAHRLEQGNVGPFSFRGLLLFSFSILRTVSRNSRSSTCRRSHDMAGHDRGGSLAERTSLHVMGEVGDDRTFHLEVDSNGRAAELEWAVAVASGSGSRPRRGIFPANSMIRLLW